MIVLDTNVLSELIRPKPDERVTEWLDSLDASTVATTTITAAELLHGVARLSAGRRRSRLTDAIQALLHEDLGGRIEPFDLTAAEHCAQIVSDRDSAGRPITMADAQIASICRRLGSTLATRNTGDFQNTGVALIDPWQPGETSP